MTVFFNRGKPPRSWLDQRKTSFEIWSLLKIQVLRATVFRPIELVKAGQLSSLPYQGRPSKIISKYTNINGYCPISQMYEGNRFYRTCSISPSFLFFDFSTKIPFVFFKNFEFFVQVSRSRYQKTENTKLNTIKV